MGAPMMRKRIQAERPYRDRQAEVMMFIRRCLDATGKFPTKAAIQRAMGAKSPSAARDMLERLTIAGHLNRVHTDLDTPEGKRTGFVYELARK